MIYKWGHNITWTDAKGTSGLEEWPWMMEIIYSYPLPPSSFHQEVMMMMIIWCFNKLVINSKYCDYGQGWCPPYEASVCLSVCLSVLQTGDLDGDLSIALGVLEFCLAFVRVLLEFCFAFARVLLQFCFAFARVCLSFANNRMDHHKISTLIMHSKWEHTHTHTHTPTHTHTHTDLHIQQYSHLHVHSNRCRDTYGLTEAHI